MNLQENISRIKSMMMITERKKPYLEFIKKNGFELECAHCDSNYPTKEGELSTPGLWSRYYLIINNKNSCSQFPLNIYGYDRSSFSLAYPIYPVGDALIVVDFSDETKIIEAVQVLLCDKLYTKEKFLKFKEVFKSNSPKNNNGENDDSHDGAYWVWLKNLTYETMEEMIYWLNSGHQITAQNLMKPEAPITTTNDLLNMT
jgi:hypothetical protein